MPLLHRTHPAHPPPVPRHNIPVVVHITVCTSDRQPVLANERAHLCLRARWTEATRWRVGNYVIMPDHLHLFCVPGMIQAEPLAAWIAYWKRMVSRDLREIRPLWQKDFWDTQMRTLSQYTEKLSYVRMNPVRKGLAATPHDWPFSGELNVISW